ncbi:MAG: threo-3-hydroxy-L-aspartate ammonia-lyase [Chloroflexi bacterium]|nr:threo-3-hydroxy-L-aspartate ammonia-lyase [Chloroflexota bacterium]
MSLSVTFTDVRAAAARLHGIANRTPVMTSRTFDALTARQVFFKCENFQRGGAFKFRGAYNRLAQLNDDAKKRGVVAFSSGNHAQGVALAAKLLGIPATIVMPDDAPPVKLAATRGYGAEVIVYDRLRESREEIAKKLADERGVTLVPPFNDPHIIAGQGTAALELLEEIPDLDALVTPVGGGGLISGCAIAAKALRPAIQVFGVEALGADDAKQSLQRGEIVHIGPPTTIADGIRTQSVGTLTFAIMRELLNDIVIVSDDEILDAVRFVLTRMKIVAEPTGAVPIAAVMQNRIPANLKRVGVIISGGNIGGEVLGTIGMDQ